MMKLRETQVSSCMRSWMICFALGICLATLVPALPAFNVLWLLIPLIVLTGLLRLPLTGAYLCGLGWGLFFLQLAASAVLPSELEDRDLWISGRITGLPQRDQNSLRFHIHISELCLQPELIACEGQWQFWDAKVRLNDYGVMTDSASILSGQQVLLQTRLKRPRGFSNPHTFDYEAWLWEQGIRATGYVRASASAEITGKISLESILDESRFRLREKLHQVIREQLPGGLSQQPVILALVLGDRYGINDGQWDLFSRTGITHLMVISGLHIGLMAWLCFRLGHWLWSRSSTLMCWLPSPRVGALSGIAGAVLYAAIAGFSLPASRALVMAVLFLWSQFMLSQTSALNTLCLALGLLLFINPLAPVTAGFWLSFGAVALLLCIALKPPQEAGKSQAALLDTLETPGFFGRLQSYISLHLQTQWLLLIGLLPLMLVFYGQVSLLAPLVNLLAIPLIGIVVVPLCLVSLPLLFLWPSLAANLLLLADCLLEGFQEQLTHLLSLMPADVINFPGLPWWKLMILGIGCLLLLQPRRRWRPAGLAGLLVLVFPGGNLPTLEAGEARFHILDVGQGLAMLIETRNHLVIYDTGPQYSERFNAGSGVIVPYIQGAGLPSPTIIVISHGDSDHAGGLSALLSVFSTAEIVSGEPSRLGAYEQAGFCQNGSIRELDDVLFLILQDSTAGVKANNRSCVLKVSVGSRHVLIPGDIERDTEMRLLATYREVLKSEVMIVPHHGSQTSSSPAFLNHVKPQLAIVSNGYLNRYGHPHEKVRRRYLNRNIRLLETAREGAVVFTLSEKGTSEPLGWRNSYPRVWRNL